MPLRRGQITSARRALPIGFRVLVAELMGGNGGGGEGQRRNIQDSTRGCPGACQEARHSHQEGAPMPAVTVNALTTLGRLAEPGLGEQPRPVLQVTTAPRGYEGEGFPVRRAFAGIDMAL